jgi:glycerate 2-kinase
VNPLADAARGIFAAAVSAVQPAALLRRVRFRREGVEFAGEAVAPADRLVLVALGKAAPGLAAAFVRASRRAPDLSFVLAPDGAPVPSEIVDSTRLARHPLPDERGAAATRELLKLLTSLRRTDGVVLLLSGGGSALLAEPLPGLALDDLAALTHALLVSGATIHELNAVRKHLFAAAGGRLGLACAAPMLTLVLSDVPGDDLATVASGPTLPDPTTRADALAVLRRRHLAERFPAVVRCLLSPTGADEFETPKPDDLRLAHVRAFALGSSRDALAAAGEAALQAGFRPLQLTRTLRGEARRVGAALAGMARSLAAGEPAALLAAGETTVTVRGAGRGGRNLELALAAAVSLADVPERCLLAAGTDGVDGSSPAAGAVVDGSTLAHGTRAGRDALAALETNDSWGYFAGLPEEIFTGPTGTNVGDLVVILAAGARAEFFALDAILGRQLPLDGR